MRLVTTAGIFLMIMVGLRAQQSAKPFPDKKGHVWQTAKVLNTTAAKTYLEEGDRAGGSTTVTVQDTEIVLVTDEFAYVVNDSRTSGRIPLHHGAIGDIAAIGAGRHHGCRFIVNDEVQFYQDKTTLHVLDADHKECKTDIVRQERLKKPAQPAESSNKL